MWDVVAGWEKLACHRGRSLCVASFPTYNFDTRVMSTRAAKETFLSVVSLSAFEVEREPGINGVI